MKAIVKTGFIDKYTGEGYCIGDVITLTEKRFKEIKLAGDYVDKIKEIAIDEKSKRKKYKGR